MNQIKINFQRRSIVFALLLLNGACGRFYQPNFVEFDDASAYCKESRNLIVIQSKMIPSDETLANEAKNRTSDGTVIEANSAAQSNHMLIDEDAEERFFTLPQNRFSVVAFQNGKHLVYWIHLVSSDGETLAAIEKSPSRVYKAINEVLVQFYSSGKLKTAGIEPELNDAILKELKTISLAKKVTRVFIHLGC